MGTPKIRPYRSEDRPQVRRICFDTGFMGDPIAPQYGDLESFADMFTAYYTDHEPESCFVVDLDDRVVGYLVGTTDTRRARGPGSYMARHALLRALGLRPATARFFWRGIFDSCSDALRGAPHTRPDLEKYPAHTHFNLLPEARLAPVAAGLYRSFFKHAKARGCAGVHGEVFVENERAAALHRAMGFATEGTPSPAPGMRSAEGRRMSVQLWTRKL
jgi:ribosomal protein S18 acetylase RimI-like enzyme